MKYVKFTFDTDEIKEGIIIEDELFLGGYKIIYENSVLSLNIVNIIEEPEINI